jgi:hypothetical protein
MCHSIKCPGGKIPDPETEPEAYAVYQGTVGSIYELEKTLQTVCNPKSRINKNYPDLSRRVIEKANQAIRDPTSNRKFAGVTANMQVQLKKAKVTNVREKPKRGLLDWLFR